jgi:hypothetical protein
MLIALCVVAAVVVLLGLHLVALPIAKKRAVLLRGAEPAVMLALLIVGASIAQPVLSGLLVVQLVVALVWRPWLVLLVSREQVTAAIVKAASMVRLRIERPANARFTLAKIGSASVVGVAGVQVIAFRVRRTGKLVLFQNVLRKTVQNYSLASRVR